MLGLARTLGRDPFFGETLPALAARRRAATPSYVPSAPCGGDVPFRPRPRRRQLLRRRRVPAAPRATPGWPASASRPSASRSRTSPTTRRSSACRGATATSSSTTRAGRRACPATTARAGTSTTSATTTCASCSASTRPRCADVDHERYLELSRAVTGEVMAEVFGEWRRAGSPMRRRARAVAARPACPAPAGASSTTAARPKAAYHHLRRALAPVAVWMTDEGLGGVAVHVANDRPDAARRAAAGRALPRRRASRSARPSAAVERARPRARSSATSRRCSAASSTPLGLPLRAARRRTSSSRPSRATRRRPASQAFCLPGRDAPAPRRAPPRGSASRRAVAAADGTAGARVTQPPRSPTACASTSRGFVADDDAFRVEPGHERARLDPRAWQPTGRPPRWPRCTSTCGGRRHAPRPEAARPAASDRRT